MSLNLNDKREIIKIAESKGYKVNSDGTKLIHNSGKWIKFSTTGNSANVNSYGGYNTPNGVRNSSHL